MPKGVYDRSKAKRRKAKGKKATRKRAQPIFVVTQNESIIGTATSYADAEQLIIDDDNAGDEYHILTVTKSSTVYTEATSGVRISDVKEDNIQDATFMY